MKSATRFIPVFAVAFALGAVSACETGYGGGVSYYEGYYDNHYGPVRRGYWDDDGYFYYRTQRDRGYVRDESRHFRRDFQNGSQPFRYRGEAPHRPGRR